MNLNKTEQFYHSMKSGQVYRREDLLSLSKAVDRDLAVLVKSGRLHKVGEGLYYKPKPSRFGFLPPSGEKLAKAFLRNDTFLLFSWNEYNSLGLGLTQLYNRQVVYNRKRHGKFLLANQMFDFRRPTRGFPAKLTVEFLLVDLLNNLNELAEDALQLKQQIKEKLSQYNIKKLLQCARKYGKIATLRFFEEVIYDKAFLASAA